MKELVEFIAKNIVDTPKEISIEETNENGFDILKLKVAQEDMGKVIGKSGKIIKAIRNMVKIKAIKENKRIRLELVE